MSDLPDYSGYLHVVAAVVVDRQQRILISRRHDHLHQGGLWEFPGGKVEAGETVSSALSRELAEELGIRVRAAHPLIRIPYHYSDRRVLLDVWRVEQFDGEAHGMEGQPVLWVSADQLCQYTFPDANRTIITAARLPSLYLITPEPGPAKVWPEFLQRLRRVLLQGIRLVQLRSKSLPLAELSTLAGEVADLCEEFGATLLVNTSPEAMKYFPTGVGLHLSGSELMCITNRHLPSERWLAASCHTYEDLLQAQQVGVDFVVVSPIKVTSSHPEAHPIGWEGLRAFTERSALPVYALGGLTAADLALSWAHGAQGVAAIRGIWGEDNQT